MHQDPLSGEMPRRYGAHLATVVNRNDPERLGRITFSIKGLVEPESAWALPMGMPGAGSTRRGTKFVPKIGADVVIFFVEGDVDRPLYLCGAWGIPEQADGSPGVRDTPQETDPEEGLDTTADNDPDVVVTETDSYSILIDERPGKERLVLKHKKSGDYIEHDGGPQGPGWTIKGSAGVVIESDGIVSVQGSRVVINERTVTDGARPI